MVGKTTQPINNTTQHYTNHNTVTQFLSVFDFLSACVIEGDSSLLESEEQLGKLGSLKREISNSIPYHAIPRTHMQTTQGIHLINSLSYDSIRFDLFD